MSKPISFIVITYNRPDDMYELVKNISYLQNADSLLQEVIIINNASTVDYSLVENFIKENKQIPFVYKYTSENLGVTKGRNYALQFATGNYYIFLDDDAVLQNTDALEKTLQSFNTKSSIEREVAIVSFKVLYYDTLAMQVNALPHKKFEKYKLRDSFYTYFFAGGAHAIKASVLKEVGNLPEDFFYGMEEYDLSYRIINRNYAIKYDSSIVMLHKESPLGRKPKWEKLQMMWVNKSIVAYKYLPIFYFFTTCIMWSFEFLKQSNFNLIQFFIGWTKIFKIPSSVNRNKLSKNSLVYLKNVEARLWY
jgi:GT2 family glycosyltransferase